jgi:hypothetical protein
MVSLSNERLLSPTEDRVDGHRARLLLGRAPRGDPAISRIELEASSVVVNPLCAAHSGATHSATSVPSHCRNPFDRFMSLSS